MANANQTKTITSTTCFITAPQEKHTGYIWHTLLINAFNSRGTQKLYWVEGFEFGVVSSCLKTGGGGRKKKNLNRFFPASYLAAGKIRTCGRGRSVAKGQENDAPASQMSDYEKMDVRAVLKCSMLRRPWKHFSCSCIRLVSIYVRLKQAGTNYAHN